jgi:hypothetical protein
LLGPSGAYRFASNGKTLAFALQSMGLHCVIAIRHKGAEREIKAEIATELLMAGLRGWTFVYCAQSERPRIHVPERR